ncbi:MAG: MCE family protein [Blastochloris viridis]|uniref:MCE family protein n=1 Tax=Blastochloris viridis TaxID=1079 RepID=A0A6N4R7Z2_BLAVI|nr:MAG: MCE family protein [Blastochloris viridis]
MENAAVRCMRLRINQLKRSFRMEPNQKYATVGAFLIITIVAFVAICVWLQGALANRDKACYVMRFDNSVAGLSQGSTITFRGVGVGQVESIRINPRNDAEILVRAALDKQTPIKASTVATLKPQGITGGSYIELDLKNGETRSGQPMGKDEECRLITTLPSGIDQIVNRLPQILDNALVVTQRLSDLLDTGNVENVNGTLANLNKLTEDLSKASSELGPQLEQAGSQLTAAMENLNKMSKQFESNGSTAASFQQTIRDAQSTIEEVKALTEEIRSNPRRMLLTPKVNEVKVP